MGRMFRPCYSYFPQGNLLIHYKINAHKSGRGVPKIISVEQLYKDVIQRYINMGVANYLRDCRRDHHLKKSAELRKRVLQRQERKKEQSDSVPYQV